MYRKKNISIDSICLIIFFSLNTMAQDKSIDKKNFSEDLLKIYNPWISTHNFSGLYYLGQKKISEISIRYNNSNGHYARSMDASDINRFTVGTYGYQKYKGFGLYGKFEYINSYEDNVKWCDVMNPYNGNPYILGDEIGGDYHKELFHMAGGISSTLFGENSIWGVGVDYVSGTGGKDNDPRPLNKIMKVEIKPGLLFSINDMRIGFNFIYSYNKEEIEMRAFVDNEVYKIYKFLGFGIYICEDKYLFDRNYFSNMYGGNMQLGFNIGNIENISELGFSYKKEDIEDGENEINVLTLYEEENISLKSNFIYKTDNIIHNLILSGEFYDRMGTFNVNKNEGKGFVDAWIKYADNKDYTNKLTKLALDYSIYGLKSKYNQDWKAEISVEYFDNNKKYKYDPELLEEYYQGVDIHLAFTKNFTISKKSLLAINLNGGYEYNLDNKLYILDDSNKDELLIDDIYKYIVEDVVKTDNEWAIAHVMRLGGFIKYSLDVNIGKKPNSAYLKLAADYFSVNSGMFDGENRTNLYATLGIVF